MSWENFPAWIERHQARIFWTAFALFVLTGIPSCGAGR